MVCNQLNLNKIGINEFLSTLRSIGVNKDDISGEPLKTKYTDVAPYITQQLY